MAADVPPGRDDPSGWAVLEGDRKSASPVRLGVPAWEVPRRPAQGGWPSRAKLFRQAELIYVSRDESGESVVRSMSDTPANLTGDIMIVLGIILLVVGFLLGINILWTLGIILVVVGVILVLLGSVGRPVLGRRHYW